MKHNRVIGASFAAVLSPLAVLRPLAALCPLVGIAAGLAGALPARGGDVPFTEREIAGSVNEDISVFATDLDGDGDIDLLQAGGINANSKISWYENLMQHADLDFDGDVDLDDFAMFQKVFTGAK